MKVKTYSLWLYHKTVDHIYRLSPQSVYLYFALFFGISFAVLTPPIYTPDESHHLYRAFQVSEGVWMAEYRQDLHGGGEIPRSLPQFVEESVRNGLDAFKKPNYNIDDIIALYSQDNKLNPEDRVYFPFPNVAVYSPVPYIPQAIAMYIGRLFDASPAILFLLGRLANLIVGILLTYYAIKLSPTLKWFLVLMGLMPMTIAQYASLSADTLTIATAILFFSLVMRARISVTDTKERKFILIASIIVSAIALGMCKQAYFPMVFLVFLIPLKFFNNKWSLYLSFLFLLFVMAIVPPVLWNMSVKHMYVNPHGQSIDERSQYLLDNPVAYVIAILRVLFSYDTSLFYFDSTIGRLGWLTVKLPFVMHIIPYFVLLFLSAILNRKDRQSWFEGLFVFGLAVFNVILILTTVFIAWSKDFENIDGVQGRYFIPLLPLFALALSNRAFVFRPENKRWKLYLLLFILYSMLSTLFFSFLWFYK
jgi:uncharacterized membrane protein